VEKAAGDQGKPGERHQGMKTDMARNRPALGVRVFLDLKTSARGVLELVNAVLPGLGAERHRPDPCAVEFNWRSDLAKTGEHQIHTRPSVRSAGRTRTCPHLGWMATLSAWDYIDVKREEE
jgi:hypothetical protein